MKNWKFFLKLLNETNEIIDLERKLNKDANKKKNTKKWDYITKTISNKKNPQKSWKTLKILLNENEIKTNKNHLFNEAGDKITEKTKNCKRIHRKPKKKFTPNVSNDQREHYVREHWFKNHQPI